MDALGPDNPWEEFSGHLELAPGTVRAIDARVIMTCEDGTTWKSGALTNTMAVGYTIAGQDRQENLDMGYTWGWLKYREPQQMIDDFVEVR